jgi:hypothetical protein
MQLHISMKGQQTTQRANIYLDNGIVVIDAHVLAPRRKPCALDDHQSGIIINERTLPALKELEDG